VAVSLGRKTLQRAGASATDRPACPAQLRRARLRDVAAAFCRDPRASRCRKLRDCDVQFGFGGPSGQQDPGLPLQIQPFPSEWSVSFAADQIGDRSYVVTSPSSAPITPALQNGLNRAGFGWQLGGENRLPLTFSKKTKPRLRRNKKTGVLRFAASTRLERPRRQLLIVWNLTLPNLPSQFARRVALVLMAGYQEALQRRTEDDSGTASLSFRKPSRK